MHPARHDLPITVRPDDIDFMGHVNNAVYLNWVQQAVLAHWRSHVDHGVSTRYLWIALKHEITYLRPAFLDDPIVATVLLETIRRESAFYDTVIRRGDDILARVKSRWCCIDAATRRPARLRADIIHRFTEKAIPAGSPEASITVTA